MLPYWLMFFWFAARAATEQRPKVAADPEKHQGPKGWGGVFVVLTLFVGLRHEVGGDWFTYAGHIEQVKGETLRDTFAIYNDIAYKILNWIGANIVGGEYFVNLVSAAVFTWGLLTFCKSLARPWLALAVAMPYLILVVAMGYTRQSAAIGLAMIAMVALGKGQMARYLLWLGAAALFHKSAIILAPFAIFATTRNRFINLIAVGLSSIALYYLLLQERLDFMIYGYIELAYSSSGAAIRIAMNAVPALMFLLYRKRFQLNQNHHGYWVWMSLAALAFIPILLVSPSSTAVDRIALYWIPIQLFMLSKLPEALSQSTGNRSFIRYSVIGYSGLAMFVWLVFATHSYVWLPYRSYLLTWF